MGERESQRERHFDKFPARRETYLSFREGHIFREHSQDQFCCNGQFYQPKTHTFFGDFPCEFKICLLMLCKRENNLLPDFLLFFLSLHWVIPCSSLLSFLFPCTPLVVPHLVASALVWQCLPINIDVLSLSLAQSHVSLFTGYWQNGIFFPTRTTRFFLFKTALALSVCPLSHLSKHSVSAWCLFAW